MAVHRDFVRVFLSSPMHTQPWIDLRHGLLELFAVDPRCDPYELYGIDRDAQAQAPRAVYLRRIADSHVVIVLLGEVLRDAVREEVERAIQLGIPIIPFQDVRLTRSDELADFVREVLYPGATAGEFSSLGTLHTAMRRALVAHLVSSLEASDAVDSIATRANLQLSEPVELEASEVAKLRTALGILRLHQGRPEEAREAFEEAVAHDPENFEAQLNLGHVRDSFPPQDFEGAIQASRAAVVLKPEHPHAQLNLALALEHSGRVEEAVETYLRADTMFGDAIDGPANIVTVGKLNLFLVGALVSLGDRSRYHEAKDRLEQARAMLSLFSKHAEAQFWLSKVPEWERSVEEVLGQGFRLTSVSGLLPGHPQETDGHPIVRRWPSSRCAQHDM